jgi:hypothetical protein
LRRESPLAKHFPCRGTIKRPRYARLGCCHSADLDEQQLFTGAFSIFRNPSAHQEVKFEEPREVVDMICFANQLLRMVTRM